MEKTNCKYCGLRIPPSRLIRYPTTETCCTDCHHRLKRRKDKQRSKRRAAKIAERD